MQNLFRYKVINVISKAKNITYIDVLVNVYNTLCLKNRHKGYQRFYLSGLKHFIVKSSILLQTIITLFV